MAPKARPDRGAWRKPVESDDDAKEARSPRSPKPVRMSGRIRQTVVERGINKGSMYKGMNVGTTPASTSRISFRRPRSDDSEASDDSLFGARVRVDAHGETHGEQVDDSGAGVPPEVDDSGSDTEVADVEDDNSDIHMQGTASGNMTSYYRKRNAKISAEDPEAIADEKAGRRGRRSGWVEEEEESLRTRIDRYIEEFATKYLTFRVFTREAGHVPKSGSAADIIEALKADEKDREELRKLWGPGGVEAASLVDRKNFNIFMCSLTVVNLATIGLETDLGAADPAFESLFQAINALFLLAYCGEWIARFLNMGIFVFSDKVCMIDFFVVAASCFERFSGNGKTTRSAPAFRLVRLFRLARMLKLLDLSPYLRALVGIAGRMFQTLAWAILILFVLLWSMAAFSVKVIGSSSAWSDTRDPADTQVPFGAFDNVEYFGGILDSVFTLLQVATLSDWGRVARPIVKVYPSMVGFFIFFILLAAYGILCAIISNFVHSAMTSTQVQALAVEKRHKEEAMDKAEEITELLTKMDTDGNMELDVEEIDAALCSPEIRNRLIDLGVPSNMDGASMMQVLDVNNGGTLSYDEFSDGIVTMNDQVCARDYTKVQLRCGFIKTRMSVVELRLHKLEYSVIELNKKFGFAAEAVEEWRKSEDTKLVLKEMEKSLRSGKDHIPKAKGKEKYWSWYIHGEEEFEQERRAANARRKLKAAANVFRSANAFKKAPKKPEAPRGRGRGRGRGRRAQPSIPGFMSDDEDEVLPPDHDAPALEDGEQSMSPATNYRQEQANMRLHGGRDLLPDAAHSMEGWTHVFKTSDNERRKEDKDIGRDTHAIFIASAGGVGKAIQNRMLNPPIELPPDFSAPSQDLSKAGLDAHRMESLRR